MSSVKVAAEQPILTFQQYTIMPKVFPFAACLQRYLNDCVLGKNTFKILRESRDYVQG
jgi:hypothetical protein